MRKAIVLLVISLFFQIAIAAERRAFLLSVDYNGNWGGKAFSGKPRLKQVAETPSQLVDGDNLIYNFQMDSRIEPSGDPKRGRLVMKITLGKDIFTQDVQVVYGEPWKAHLERGDSHLDLVVDVTAEPEE